MKLTAKKIGYKCYQMDRFEIEYNEVAKAWSVFEIVPCIWDETKTDREWVTMWNTLRECKEAVAEIVASEK